MGSCGNARRALACAVVLSAACARERAAPAAAPANRGTAREVCLDAELARRGLNSFGDSKDTAYAGGTPLFDERTGQRRERVAWLLEHRPELAARCPP